MSEAGPQAPWRRDLLAGLTVTLVGIPQCLAYALMSGLPPAYGLATAAVPGIVAALTGRSAQVVTGPTNTTGLLVLAALGPWLGADGLLTEHGLPALATLTLMAGVLRLVLSSLGGATLIRFVPESVLAGFTAGAGLLIAVMQLDEALGFAPINGGSLWGEFAGLWQRLSDGIAPNLAAIATTVAVILAITVGRRALPKLPVPLLTIIAASLGAWAVGAGVDGTFGLRVVGDAASVPSGWPPGALPTLDPVLLRQFLMPAAAITLLGTLELTVSARAQGARPDMAVEIRAQGWANVAGAFASAFPASASLTRSALLRLGGARTRLAAVSAGVTVIPVLLFAGDAVAWIPQAALAGVLFVTAWGMVDIGRLGRMWRAAPVTRNLLVITFIATLVLPLEVAIVLGLGLGLAVHLLADSEPRIRLLAPRPDGEGSVPWPGEGDEAAPEAPEVLVIEVSGSLHYASIDAYLEALDAPLPASVRGLVVDLSHTHRLRYAALLTFERQRTELEARGVRLALAGVPPAFLGLVARTQSPLRVFPEDPIPGASLARAVAAVRETLATGDPPTAPDQGA